MAPYVKVRGVKQSKVLQASAMKKTMVRTTTTGSSRRPSSSTFRTTLPRNFVMEGLVLACDTSAHRMKETVAIPRLLQYVGIRSKNRDISPEAKMFIGGNMSGFAD